ncbi:MAG: SLBB domain-containing protein [Acidobacteria bacterium]|uniref:SLBB domain-containing protein n=1 Tax=Candidatus Polarisedimenticola svalbardensis TaxID=2886004 RepID=A0A8J7CCG0_9BACT|nr:SLBB domain-containing protein [Candidatus Polarisedimenticola svalbardensis]
MDKAGARREEILERLEAEGGVTPESVARIALETGVPEADVWGAGRFYSLIREPGRRVRVCTGLSCRLAGATHRIEELERSGEPREEVSCIGQCDRAPAALDPDLELIPGTGTASSVLPDDPALPVNLGGADPAGYEALAKAQAAGPESVLGIIEASGLQGRGGAGFPAHVKWRAVAGQAERSRYVVCNADEGEPGTFKDREIMERRPHLLLEGLAVAAATIAASEIIIYIRGEFRDAKRSLETALKEAAGHLEPFDIRFANGHGAYICGEETALLESLEGKRGMPRLKPPFPTENGFRGKPTLIHNVETAACVPFIIHHGGERFRDLGRTGAGTKLYCVSGHVNRPGVYELPLGVALDELVETAGGYTGSPMAFSPGGASSGFLPMSLRGLPLDFRSLDREGSMLGSAGVVVLNDTVDLVAAADWQTRFFDDESCGQCAPCRIGARFLRNACGRFRTDGDPDALLHVEDVGWEMEEGSICGLGMVAAKPLTSAMKHFPDAFRRQR